MLPFQPPGTKLSNVRNFPQSRMVLQTVIFAVALSGPLFVREDPPPVLKFAVKGDHVGQR